MLLMVVIRVLLMLTAVITMMMMMMIITLMKRILALQHCHLTSEMSGTRAPLCGKDWKFLN